MSKEIITEARELCEKATLGPWKVVDGKSFGVQSENKNIASCFKRENEIFIARSRTLIPELCDALEKAQDEKQREFDIATGYYNKWQKALTELDRLTEAQRWIAVEERLPVDGRFLCAYKVASLGTCVSILNYAAQLESVDEYNFEGYDHGGFYTYDSEAGCFEWPGVTHWRELPEPPKGE